MIGACSIDAASFAKMFRFVTRSSTITMIDISPNSSRTPALLLTVRRHNARISLRESELGRRFVPTGGRRRGESGPQFREAIVDISDLSTVELADRFAKRTLSPVETLRAVLAVVETWEPQLRATYAFDPARR